MLSNNAKQTGEDEMKLSKIKAGEYQLTGHIADNLVQYSIEKNAHIWEVTKTYGTGPDFHLAYDTLNEAMRAVFEFSDY